MLAVAGQNGHLFSTTIRENVRLARPDATDAEVEEALRRARISDWVSTLPHGLDTLVSEEGRWLSAGQRQRPIWPVRFWPEAPVVILDEPTAHLDPETAQALMDDVLDVLGEKTLLSSPTAPRVSSAWTRSSSSTTAASSPARRGAAPATAE